MAKVTVMDINSPSKDGPGHLSAKTALDAINAANPGWNVTMDWKKNVTTYTSNVANRGNLIAAVQPHFAANLYLVN